MGWFGGAPAAARTDSDISDEPAGIARAQHAAASKQRREDQAKALAAANRAQKERLAKADSGMDTDVTDEAAYQRGLELAAASDARRALEEKELRSHAAATRDRVKSTQSATDGDMTDEAAWQRKLELRAQSRQQRAASRKYLKASNEALAARMRSGASRVFAVGPSGERQVVLPKHQAPLTSQSEQELQEAAEAAWHAAEALHRARAQAKRMLTENQMRVRAEVRAAQVAKQSSPRRAAASTYQPNSRLYNSMTPAEEMRALRQAALM